MNYDQAVLEKRIDREVDSQTKAAPAPPPLKEKIKADLAGHPPSMAA